VELAFYLELCLICGKILLFDLKSNKFTKSVKVLGLANAFSGGLFMGISLFHLLPEVSIL